MADMRDTETARVLHMDGHPIFHRTTITGDQRCGENTSEHVGGGERTELLFSSRITDHKLGTAWQDHVIIEQLDGLRAWRSYRYPPHALITLHVP